MNAQITQPRGKLCFLLPGPLHLLVGRRERWEEPTLNFERDEIRKLPQVLSQPHREVRRLEGGGKYMGHVALR